MMQRLTERIKHAVNLGTRPAVSQQKCRRRQEKMKKREKLSVMRAVFAKREPRETYHDERGVSKSPVVGQNDNGCADIKNPRLEEFCHKPQRR